MDIFIDSKSNKPIYEQITNQIKTQIMDGTLSAHMLLPSIRSFAKDLGISVITTKRAYDELEKEGFIYTLAAKGCFVTDKNPQLYLNENNKRIDALLEEAMHLAKISGYTKDDIIYRITHKEDW